MKRVYWLALRNFVLVMLSLFALSLFVVILTSLPTAWAIVVVGLIMLIGAGYMSYDLAKDQLWLEKIKTKDPEE